MTYKRSYLSSAPYFPAIPRNKWAEKSHLEREYRIEVFADMVQLSALNPPMPDLTPSKRKNVKGFSDKSRKRMIEMLAKIEEVPDLFVTLTYSDDIVEYAYPNTHRHFEAFRKRLERAYTGIKAMWRLELVPRKSGKFYGSLQPHFHLLVWLPDWLSDFQREKILENDGQKWREAWHEITESTHPEHLRVYGCQVQKVRSRRHAYSYASKYMAKDDIEVEEIGRRWGRIGDFEVTSELDDYLTRSEYKHFKRMLNAYLKAEALAAWKRNLKRDDGKPVLPLKHFMKFYKFFKRMNILTGSSVFGLGYVSQRKPIGLRTVYKMIKLARELASEKTFGKSSQS